MPFLTPPYPTQLETISVSDSSSLSYASQSPLIQNQNALSYSETVGLSGSKNLSNDPGELLSPSGIGFNARSMSQEIPPIDPYPISVRLLVRLELSSRLSERLKERLAPEVEGNTARRDSTRRHG